MSPEREGRYRLGLLGLGVMGSALARNLIRHEISTALYSVSQKEREAHSLLEGPCVVCGTIGEFVGALERPRKIFLMILAGEPVDEMIQTLLPLLDPGDVLMDGGNSHYRDTERRCRLCRKKGIGYLGIGVSGGEKGALTGPSLMAGGDRCAWEQAGPLLTQIAAFHRGKPCCGYVAEGGSGHYVKMAHNGIEYAILELIAETVCYLRGEAGLSPDQTGAVLERWNRGVLGSYLMEISARVIWKRDGDQTPLVDRILDVAGQKGTGRWSEEEAAARGVPTPSIYGALMARNLSGQKTLREEGAAAFPCTAQKGPLLTEEELEQALSLAVFLAYSQGFELIARAGEEEGWRINLRGLAGIWGDGCIIRGRILDRISESGFTGEKPLLFEPAFSDLRSGEAALRRLTSAAALAGECFPAFGGALFYYDGYRTGRMPVFFIQALRDCFGAHTYRRTDREGSFHTEW